MTFKELAKWNVYEELDDYSKIFIQALNPGFVQVKRDRITSLSEVCLRKSDLVATTLPDFQKVGVNPKKKQRTGSVYQTKKGDIYISKTGYIYNHAGKVVNDPRFLFKTVLEGAQFKYYTVSPEVEEVFFQTNTLVTSPYWWRSCVKYIKPDHLEVYKSGWVDNYEAPCDTKAYRIGKNFNY